MADAKEVKVEVKKEKGHDEEQGGDDNWVKSEGLTTAEAEELLKKWGRNELPEKSKSKLKLFLEQFYAPMPCMIWAAVAIEGAILNWPDFGILLALQFINGTVSFHEAAKAGDAVAALKKSLKPNAHVKRDGKWQTIDAGLLVPGDLVSLGSGSAVPADCRVNGGRIEVDQAALTGESLPVPMVEGGQPKMGSTVTRGEVEGTVEFTGVHTFFGKTAAMIQSVEGMSHFQLVLLRIMMFLLGISFFLCIIILIYLLVRGEPGAKAIGFVVVLLVASIPLAIEVVTTTTMAIGSRQLVAKNAIVARLAAIEELAGMNMLCSDKTGTLTLNKMMIQEETPIFKEGLNQYEVLRQAALAAKWHEPPKDALDTLVLGAADLPSLDPEFEQVDYLPFDPVVKRTEGTIKSKKDGSTFKVTKGAPHILVALCTDEAVKARVGKLVDEFAERGIRSLAVARTLPGKLEAWEMLGILTFLDPPRPDTKETLFKAMEYGIDVKMVTGDHRAIAKETCRQLGLGTNVLNAEGLPSMGADGKAPDNLKEYAPMIIEADGFAQVFPEHKFLIVEALRQQGFAVGMTGDGVNDAPALKKADIGIAVQGATDAARAAADIVLTSPGLSVVIDAITISRCIFQRIRNFVLYRVACTLQLLVFFFIAVLGFHPEKYAQHAGASNALMGTSADGWTAKNSEGTMIAWHRQECAYADRFFPVRNVPSGNALNAQFTDLTWASKAGQAPFAPPEWSSAGVPAWLKDAGPNMGAVGDTKNNVFCTPVIYSTTGAANYTYLEPAYFNPATGVFSNFTTPAGSILGWRCQGAICAERWDKYFAFPVIALIVITLLNDGTIISIAYDHVEPSKYPEKWNLPVDYMISSVLGGFACAASILLLHLTLDSHNVNGTWFKRGGAFGLPMLTYGNVVNALYLQVSLTDFLTLFSARTTRFFFSVRPAPPLMVAAVFALGASTALAALWPFNEDKDVKEHGFGRGSAGSKASKKGVLGVVWLYVLIWWIVQDIGKFLFYHLLEYFNVMGHNTSAFVNVRASTATTETRELAVGLVEKKYVAAAVRDVASSIDTLEKESKDKVKPQLEKLQQAMELRGNEEEVEKQAQQVLAAVSSLSADDRADLAKKMAEMKKAVGRAAVAGSVRGSMRAGGSYRGSIRGSLRTGTLSGPRSDLPPGAAEILNAK